MSPFLARAHHTMCPHRPHTVVVDRSPQHVRDRQINETKRDCLIKMEMGEEEEEREVASRSQGDCALPRSLHACDAKQQQKAGKERLARLSH
jgi:hypothetical protein